jgi:DNA-nicking Smr family endonuclease
MARHSQSATDKALWDQVAASVRPIPGRKAVTHAMPNLPTVPLRPMTRAALPPVKAMKGGGANTLDANWDNRLLKGLASPDRTIDLHGHNLASAHALLDRALGDAIRHGARLVLIVTGRPARDNPRMPPTGRGVIRASVGDWIAASSHAGHIAAVRNAHPRHGGAGALYLVLRRAR